VTPASLWRAIADWWSLHKGATRDKRTLAEHREAGSTPDIPIVIHAANSIEGIPREYAALRALFGEPTRDWKLINRRVLSTQNGRTLERFVVSIDHYECRSCGGYSGATPHMSIRF
jgi:hypothetical protein